MTILFIHVNFNSDVFTYLCFVFVLIQKGLPGHELKVSEQHHLHICFNMILL